MSDERSDEVSQTAMDAGQATGKAGARRATKKLLNQTKQAVRKATSKLAKGTAKAVAAGFKAIVVALLPFLPYVIGVLILILLIFFTYHQIVESRPKNQEFQVEMIEEMNEYGDVPDDDGYLPVETASQGNAMVKAFYTYFSDQSYWVVTEDFDDLSKPIQATDPEIDAKQIRDKYGREKMFYLNPDALFALDEFMFDGDFRVPEQFIQPVPYEVDEEANEIKLVDIYDEKEDKLNVKSTKYDKEGKPTDEKVPGVWDYGFAPVFHYKQFKEKMQYRGAVTQIQEWNKETQKADWISVPAEDASQEQTKETDLGEVWMIDQLVSPGGTIKNEINYEWEDTGEPWLPDIEDYKFTKKVEVRHWEMKHQKDEDGKKLYYHYPDDDSSLSYISTEKSEHPYRMIEAVYKKEKKTFYKKVEGTRWEKVPKYDGDPDMSGITGSKYYKDYIEHFETYLPEKVTTDLDIAKRMKTTDKKLLKAITPTDDEDEETEEATTAQVDVENLQLGANGNSEAYMKALENLPMLEKYGKMYGVDPYLMIALTAQEASGSHYDANGNVKSAANIGLMQIAKLPNTTSRSVTAYNFETGSNETFTATYQDLHAIETNIKWGMMYMADNLRMKDYDIATALQAYNFGSGYKGPWSIESALEQQQIFANGRKRSNPNNPLGPYDHGDAYYVPHVLRHYASPDTPVPYVMKKDGSIATLDNSALEMGTVDGINAKILNGQTEGKFAQLWNYVKFGWNELSEGIQNVFGLDPDNRIQFNGVKDSEPRMKVTKSKSPDEAWEITMSMLAYQEEKPLASYQGFTEEDFKDRFKLMFTNPFGDPITSTDFKSGGGINPKDFFKSGEFVSPVDKPKVASKYGFIDVKGKQVYHPGIDITVAKGQDIFAVSTGTVKSVQTGENSQIIIEHTMGTLTIYQYVGDIKVKEGDYVRMGDVIAKGGESPEKKGTFHFELRQHGQTKDPTWIVDPSKMGGGGAIVIDPAAKGLFQSPFAGKSYTKTSNYGVRLHPIHKDWRLHAGTDLVATAGHGAPIHSIADGTVVGATWHDSGGYMVTIDHGIVPEIDASQNLYSRYLHLKAGSMSVKKGDTVQKGTQIGGMGSTGGSTGDHLHFEMHLGTSASATQSFNPEQVFDF